MGLFGGMSSDSGGGSSAAGGIVMGLGEAGFSALASHKAYKRQKHIMKNMIQWRVEDMKGAGLNPILAVSPGGGSSASVAQSAPINLSRGVVAAKEFSKLSPQMKILKSQAIQADYAAQREGALLVGTEYDVLRNAVGLERDRLGMHAARAEGLFDETAEGQKLRRWSRRVDAMGGTAKGISDLFRGTRNPVRRSETRRMR